MTIVNNTTVKKIPFLPSNFILNNEKKCGVVTLLLLELVCSLFLAYGLNQYLDYFILFCFIIIVFVFHKKNILELLIPPLFFFDYVLLLPIGNGTFNRIFEALYLMFFFFNKKKTNFRLPDLIVSVLLFFS